MDDQDLSDELRNLLKTIEGEIAATRAENWSDIEQQIPPVIYHYTDDKGLLGILQHGHLWFTHLFHLNDPSELNHGVRLALSVFREQIYGSEVERVSDVLSNYFEYHLERITKSNLEDLANFFVCCFSTTSDELGQWRAYGDDGRGYAIGFDTALLEESLVQSSKAPDSLYHFSSFAVRYDDEYLRSVHRRLITSAIPVILKSHELSKSEGETYRFNVSLSERLAFEFIMASLQFKNEAYKNEREYRLVRTYPVGGEDAAVKLRTRPYELVRYVECNWKVAGPRCIKEVVCGPASEFKLTSKFAKDCLRQYFPSSEGCTIRQTQIPYRSFRS